jgi:hypothetical protein
MGNTEHLPDAQRVREATQEVLEEPSATAHATTEQTAKSTAA